jgi:hypothetical protein
MSDRLFTLCLSGGGFRATLFHLGVIRALRDYGLLGRVARIYSVSGGSILAAHLVLKWERYTGTEDTFRETAQELIDFVRSDLRGRLVRRWVVAGWLPPYRRSVRDIGDRDQLAWKHVELIRRRWKGKLVVKGLIAPQDVRIARECGVDGVMVSNHGGRQLDHTVSPLRTLPEIAAEAKGVTVILDGGVRRGTDVLKALALGAQFVFVGRPLLFAAVAAGEAGVQRALTLLKDEVDRDMALLGVRSIAEVTLDLVRRLGPDPPFGRNTP